jgi:hypothetical protein
MTNNSNSKITESLILLSLFAIAIYIYFISSTIFYIDGVMYFTLVDDAMITMRYANNFANGFGIVWNIGESPIQGFTNLGWMLYLSLIHLLPVDSSKISLLVMSSSIVILILLVSIIYKLTFYLSNSSKKTALVAAIITAFYFPLIFWSLRGMEVGLITLLIFLSALYAFKLENKSNTKYAFILGSLILLAIVVRFDSIIQIGLILLYLFLTTLKSKNYIINLIPAVFFVIGIAGLLLFQYIYFGDPLPNTYYLKVSNIPAIEKALLGLDVFFDYGVREILPLFLITVGGVIYYKELQNKKIYLLLSMFSIQVVYSIYVGGDYAEPYNRPQVDAVNRFVTQGMPALFIVFSIVIIKTIEDLLALKNRTQKEISNSKALIIAASTLLVLSAESWYKNELDGAPLLKWDIWRATLGVHIKNNTSDTASIAVHAAGQIPYYSERKTIDLLGKSDPHVARIPPATKFRPGHNKWDYNYSIKKKLPDLVADEWGKSRIYLNSQKYYKRLPNKIWIRKDSNLVDEENLAIHFIDMDILDLRFR